MPGNHGRRRDHGSGAEPGGNSPSAIIRGNAKHPSNRRGKFCAGILGGMRSMMVTAYRAAGGLMLLVRRSLGIRGGLHMMGFRPGPTLRGGETAAMLPTLLGRLAAAGVILARKRNGMIFDICGRQRKADRRRKRNQSQADRELAGQPTFSFHPPDPAHSTSPVALPPMSHDIVEEKSCISSSGRDDFMTSADYGLAARSAVDSNALGCYRGVTWPLSPRVARRLAHRNSMISS
jgi:hypothetical protein